MRKSFIFVLISYIVSLLIGYFSYLLVSNSLNILYSVLVADIVTTISIFIFSLIFNNSSVYDPYWSVIPIFIVLLWIYKLDVSILNVSTIIIIIAFLIWGTRLTYNWSVNWKGLGHEDWRYILFRNKFGKFYWLISLIGIHLFPTLMVFTGMLPIYFALESKADYNLIVLIIGFIMAMIGVLFSFLADVHLTRHRKSSNSKNAIKIGIWKYSRHPNYLGEITFWFGIFIIGLSFGMDLIFTGIGFVLMVLLFECYSIPAIEKRLKNSKNDYEEIIKNTPRLIPFTKFKKLNLPE